MKFLICVGRHVALEHGAQLEAEGLGELGHPRLPFLGRHQRLGEGAAHRARAERTGVQEEKARPRVSQALGRTPEGTPQPQRHETQPDRAAMLEMFQCLWPTTRSRVNPHYRSTPMPHIHTRSWNSSCTPRCKLNILAHQGNRLTTN